MKYYVDSWNDTAVQCQELTTNFYWTYMSEMLISNYTYPSKGVKVGNCAELAKFGHEAEVVAKLDEDDQNKEQAEFNIPVSKIGNCAQLAKFGHEAEVVAKLDEGDQNKELAKFNIPVSTR